MKSTFASRSFASFSLVALGALAWLTSLGLPAIALPGGESYRGFQVLLEGWRALAFGIPSWCANPALALALALVVARRRRAAALVSGLSLALAVSSIAASWFAERSGATLPEFEFEPGFFLWIASTLCVFAGASMPAPARSAS